MAILNEEQKKVHNQIDGMTSPPNLAAWPMSTTNFALFA